MEEPKTRSEEYEVASSEAPISVELADEELEDVAGGSIPCTPDQPVSPLPGDIFIPLNPLP